MKKKISLFLMISSLFIVTGCSDNKVEETSKYDTTGLSHITCTKDAYIESDSSAKVNINYDLYYDSDDYLKVFESVEKITSDNSSLLDQYEQAYKKIYKSYSDIKYYDNKVERTNNTVISKTSINYGKVDMKKVRELEGEEDNVKLTDGKIKIDDWKKFAKKYGTTCN